MTGNKCLLDTSIVIHSFRKENQISAKLDTIKEIYVPVIVAGELYYGAYKSSDPVKHLNRTNACLENCILLPTDVETAEIYGIIKTNLSKKGNPIPENDIWIDALSIQYELPLFTTDAHFHSIDNIQLF